MGHVTVTPAKRNQIRLEMSLQATSQAEPGIVDRDYSEGMLNYHYTVCKGPSQTITVSVINGDWRFNLPTCRGYLERCFWGGNSSQEIRFCGILERKPVTDIPPY